MYLLYVNYNISLKKCIKNRNTLCAACYWYLLLSPDVPLQLSELSVGPEHVYGPVVYTYKTSHKHS